MNKELPKLLRRIGLVSSELTNLKSKIVDILENQNYKQWRMSVPGLTEDALLQYGRIIGSFVNMPKGLVDVEQDSPGVIRDYLGQLQNMYRMSLGEERYAMLINDIVDDENDSKIELCMSGSFPKRISSGLKVKLGVIAYWLLFRIQLDSAKLYLSNKSLKSSGNINELSSANQNAIDILEAMPLPPNLQEEVQRMDIIHKLDAIAADPSSLSTYINDESDLFKFVLKLFEFRQSQWNNEKAALFQLINNIFIPLSIRRKIVQQVQQSVFKKALQTEYDIRKTYIPEITHWRFYLPDKLDTNTILPVDFRNERREYGQGMNFNLNHEEIVKLYFAMRGKYIDYETDILDFAFALTGCPVKHKAIFKKVVWINQSKQSLGIFLGLMRPKNMEGCKYWSSATKFFSYKGNDKVLKASDMSTPFGKFLKHPETRGMDWDELTSIVSTNIKRT